MSLTVSINLCCYNSEQFLEETLRSVFSQTYKDWELVVINDGSTDSTERIIQKYLSEGWPINYRCQKNMGLGYSRNKAIELSKGELIALLDHDDLWTPDKLEKQVALFDSQPEVALVYSDASVIDSMGRSLWHYSERVRQTRGWVLPHLFLDNFIVCSTVLIRRSVFDEMPWFQPSLKTTEEYELFLRIAEKYKFDFVKEPLVRYRLHQGNYSWDLSRMQHESILVSNECLSRCPNLRNQVGVPALKIRAMGLWPVNFGQALLLQGRVREATRELGGLSKTLQALPKATCLFFISLLGVQVASRLFQYWRSMRRKFAYGS